MPVKKVLFVCLGNICRSPAAEGVFRKFVERAGLSDFYLIESAGTGDWHIGHPPDQRMREAATARGYALVSLAQQIRLAHLESFDFIFTMDDSNFKNVRALDSQGLFHSKIEKFVSHCKMHQVNEVPDPYKGPLEGFELVLDILEDGCGEILKRLSAQQKGT